MGKNWKYTFFSFTMGSQLKEDKMILIYVVCNNQNEAQKISKSILNDRLCACTNILPSMVSYYFWPPTERTLVEGNEVILLIKTLESKYEEIEKAVLKLHSYDNPSIFSIKVDRTSSKYLDWVRSETD